MLLLYEALDAQLDLINWCYQLFLLIFPYIVHDLLHFFEKFRHKDANEFENSSCEEFLFLLSSSKMSEKNASMPSCLD